MRVVSQPKFMPKKPVLTVSGKKTTATRVSRSLTTVAWRLRVSPNRAYS
jgi:hypothetical protein